MNTQALLSKLNFMGLNIPFILLPQGIDLKKWSVIACDQFTQDRDYWANIEKAAAGAPSTLNMIFPEVFLSDGDAPKRIAGIHSSMKNYLQTGIFGEPEQGFIYIERDTPYQKKRRGLITAIDLEYYDWHPDARPLIRSTEGTVEDRLPPRMDIRRGAPLELPHVLLLIDDETDTLLPTLGEMLKNDTPIYNTDLMMDNGSVTGWFINADIINESEKEKINKISFITEKLEELYKCSTSRYTGNQPFLFAVGDGNHSLAAAKGIWEEYKAKYGTAGKLPEHPCRYALVEIENIYDPAIQFEPIHRIVFGIEISGIISLLSKLPDFSCHHVNNEQELLRLCSQSSAVNCFGIISGGSYALIETSAPGISTASLQPLLDTLQNSESNSIDIDYIHDKEELFRLAAGDRQAVGILLPSVNKAGLFETVARLGPLPRKSFSMGHSCEKRFYLECRNLFG